MAKCLRCGAGNEWIQGRVPDETKADAIEAALQQVDGIIGKQVKGLAARFAQHTDSPLLVIALSVREARELASLLAGAFSESGQDRH